MIRRSLDMLYLYTGYLAGACMVAIFLMMMALSIVLNLLLPELPLRTRAEHAVPIEV